MGSREKILESIARYKPPVKPLHDPKKEQQNGGEPVAEFISVLERIGGKAIRVDGWNAIKDQVMQHYPGMKRIVSTIPELPWMITNLSKDPHTFEDVDLAILPAHFGVAENAAVWITDELMGDRVLPFIAQNLALVVKGKSIVATMHEAYERIGSQSYNLGTFIAGPSKTADIEQSLVLGAHGPKSMIVFLMDDE